MPQNVFRSRIALLVGSLIVAVSLIMARTWAHSSGPPPAQAVPVQNQPAEAPLRLEIAFSGNVLVGTVTISGKDGRPWRGVRGQAYLLDSSGRQQAVVPLQPLGPGEFRLIAPLGRLDTAGYLDVRLPGRGSVGEQSALYQIDRDQQTVTWIDAALSPSIDSGLRASAPLTPQATGGPDEFGYTWDSTTDGTTYNWIDTSGGTAITLRDDDWVGPFNIGFTFDFYGQDYTKFYLDSNGYIGFDSTQTASYYANSRLPHTRRPNNLIAPFWDDFDPSQGGTVRYQTFGTSPNRYLIVEWNGVPLWGTSDAQSFQVILYEGSNDIRFQYPDTRQGDHGDRSYGTVGVENGGGTIGLEYLYVIPTTITRTVLFSYSQSVYNVFLTPERQGSPAAAGEAASFDLTVKNLGSSSDSFTLSRPDYDGSNWSVSFYEADGTTPLSGNNTGTIAAVSEKEIVAKVQVPGSASIGDWTRATIRATSQGDSSEHHEVTLDAMFGTSFAQVYTDNESGDDTEDSENYFDPLDEGHRYTKRVTTDQDDSSYAGVATTPGGNAVNVWNTTYYNGTTWVSEIQYCVLSPPGDFIQPVTRLTDNSAATQTTYDFSPAVDVASNGNIALGWARQPGTYNVWYAVVDSSGGTVKAPTALTDNTGDYPRDYPPSITALSGGRFLLAWEHAASSNGPVDIYYAVLNNDGSVAKTATCLTDGAGWNVTPRVAALPNGGAAIVWTAYNTDGYREIAYATVDSGGTVTGGPTQITSNGDSGAASIYADAVALSDGRLGVAWTQWSSSGDQDIQYTIISGSPPAPTPTPTPMPPASEGIHGQVTYQGSLIADINLVLRFHDGSEWSTADTTTTQADGTYEFAEAASLSSGQKYYVRYQNGEHGNTDNSDYLAFWSSFDITSYTAGGSVAGGDFDIANTSLVSPDPGATVALPHAFQWTRRTATTSDSYEFDLFDPNDFDPWAWTDPLGYVNSYTLDSLPSGFSTGTEYGWSVWMYGPEGGTGASYYYRRITFSSGVSKLQDEAGEECPLTGLTLSRLMEACKERLPSSGPAVVHALRTPHHTQQASVPQVIYTVPNDLSDANIYVSLTTDQNDNLIMTWLDNYAAQYLFYALADKDGDILTPATIFQRTRHSYLWSSWNGYGNDALISHYTVYLPVVLRNYVSDDPGPTPTPATPTAIPIPLTNGGFESGDFSGWTTGGDSGLTPRVVGSHGDFEPRSGSYAAVLGQEGAPCQTGQGGLVGQSWIYQDIWVPTSRSPQLMSYYRIFSYDKLNSDKYDRFEVYINGTLLGRFGNTNPGNWGAGRCDHPVDDLSWQSFTYDLSPYRGQTIQLRLVNVTHPDDWYGTWTYVDDVEITQ